MTVLENVLVGQHTRTRCGMWGSILHLPGVMAEERKAREVAMELLDFVDSPTMQPPRAAISRLDGSGFWKSPGPLRPAQNCCFWMNRPPASTLWRPCSWET